MKHFNITIAGLGWLGLPLALKLKDQGHKVSGTTRTEEKAAKTAALGIPTFVGTPDLFDCDILILNMPPDIEQLSWWQSWFMQKKIWVIFVSSTSVYEEHAGLVYEYSPIKTDHFLIQQESWIQTLPHWSILRCGGLLGLERHPGKHLAGKENLKHKNWPVNLLHLDDAIGFIVSLVESQKQNEIFNVVGNEHRSREDFYSEYARLQNLPLPKFDQHDSSNGKIIDNSKAQKLYTFKF